jgi:hypothetical protein
VEQAVGAHFVQTKIGGNAKANGAYRAEDDNGKEQKAHIFCGKRSIAHAHSNQDAAHGSGAGGWEKPGVLRAYADALDEEKAKTQCNCQQNKGQGFGGMVLGQHAVGISGIEQKTPQVAAHRAGSQGKPREYLRCGKLFHKKCAS